MYCGARGSSLVRGSPHAQRTPCRVCRVLSKCIHFFGDSARSFFSVDVCEPCAIPRLVMLPRMPQVGGKSTFFNKMDGWTVTQCHLCTENLDILFITDRPFLHAVISLFVPVFVEQGLSFSIVFEQWVAIGIRVSLHHHLNNDDRRLTPMLAAEHVSASSSTSGRSRHPLL